MKKTKKLLAALLGLACAVSALSGCGKDAPASEPASSQSSETVSSSEAETTETFDARKITEGVKLVISAQEQSKIVDYETNAITKRIEEDLGVDLEFVTFPAADYASKINIMVESGDKLPDIIFMPTNKLVSWAEQEAIIPLNKYYEDPNFSANIRAAGERLNQDLSEYMANADGIIYGVPQYGGSLGGQYAQKLWVYQPWLDAIGADIPTTTEEFYEVCKQIASKDINGNGIADELMISGCNTGGGQTWMNYLMTPFVYAHDSRYLVVEDGTLSFAYTSEGWKEGLKYIHRFFDEGLFVQEVLTQDPDQYWAQVYSETPSVFSFVGYHYANAQLENRVNYACIPALKNGEDGRALSYYNPGFPNATNPGAVISADCENPDAAFLVCDYLCDEDISISQRYGEQGINWDHWEDAKVENRDAYESAFPGYEISIFLYDNDQFWAGTDAQEICYLQKCPFIFDVGVPSGKAVLKEGATEQEKLQARADKILNTAIVECSKYAPTEVVGYMPLTGEESARISELTSTITSFVSQSRAEFLTGIKDIDGQWDAYLNELEKMGVKELLEIYQGAYDRVH